MHTKNEGKLKIFVSNSAHFSHALALKMSEIWAGTIKDFPKCERRGGGGGGGVETN